jgi:adenosine/AMP kinase
LLQRLDNFHRGIMGVIDGGASEGVEDETGVAWRKELLRKIAYKL